MPFAKRAITPVKLSRGTLGPEYKFDLDVISNNTLCGLLRQLASLAIKADSIFSEITEEFVHVVQKTEKLRERVGEVSKNVGRLNAKAVTVPVGDINTFASHSEHYQAEHGFDCYLFSPASRPTALVELYDSATQSPIATIRRCNILRSDGKTGSRFFSPAPVIKDEKYEDQDLQIASFRKPVQVLHIERETRELKSPRPHERPQSMSALTELDVSTNKANITMPTPEEKLREISRSQPVTLVPIDVSGSSFTRMCDYRSSIRSINNQYEEVDAGSLSRTARRKSRRRQTLSGLPGFVFDEINTDYFKVGSLRTRSVSRERWERPRSMAFPEVYTPNGKRGRSRERRRDKDPEREDSPVSKSCSLRRSFRSLFNNKGCRSRSQDLWAEGRPRSPGPPMIDINVPLRRSRSLPRSLKSVMRDSQTSKLINTRSASTEGRLDGWTEEELLGKDMPWVKAKPPSGPTRPIRGPRLPRSRSQTVDRRRSNYVESSDESTFGYLQPRGLRASVSHGQLRMPIPVSMPTTPGSVESLMSGATIDSNNRMNIPAQGAAWGPFASVKLRHAKGQAPPDDRQSSSGNWSASSSSARQSLESEYNRLINSPDKRSTTSTDKDSALSLNIHSSSEDRCFSYYEGYFDISDLYMYTTDNNHGDLGEETSTITGDTSTLNGGDTTAEDASTINGDQDSVVNVRANFTKMKTDEWLKSLSKDKHSRRKSQRDSTGSGLTLQNLRAHDSAHKPYVRSLTRLPDEESSVYSVDGEGFYTSMHKDSGLKRSQSEMIEEETQFELDSINSSSNSTLAGSTPVASKSYKKDKLRRRSTSFLSNLPGLRRIKGGGSKKSSKKTPPPPPRRASTVLDKSNLKLDEAGCNSPPTPSSELSKSADTSVETVINTSVPVASPIKHNDSSCESDAEAIYARIKTKSSISAAAIPSLCSITPVGSDEEDGDMLSFARTWRGSSPPGDDTSQWTGSLVSTKSAPGLLLQGQVLTSTPMNSGIGATGSHAQANKTNDDLSISDTMTRLALKYNFSKGGSVLDASSFSTWPRSPKGEKAEHILSTCTARTLDFSTKSANNSKASGLHDDSFLGSNEGSSGVGSEMDGTSSKGTSSLKSPSTSSIPSSLSDDMPVMPPKLVMRPDLAGGKNPYLPHLDGGNSSGGSGGSGCTSPVNKHTKHIFANVVISPKISSKSYPNSTLPNKSKNGHETISVTSTWPRQIKSKKDLDSVKDGGSLKKEKKKLSTFAPLEKEEEKNKEANEESLALPVNSYCGPVPAPAKLIISSPVSTQVSFKENPYKRSVCSPVSAQELMSFWNMDVKDSAVKSPLPSAFAGLDLPKKEPLPSAFSPILPSSPTALGPPKGTTPLAVSKPLFPTLTAMKHSITFPVTTKDEIKPVEKEVKEPLSTYGKSWYDGIKTKSEVVPITTATTNLTAMPSLASRSSLTSFSSDSPTPSLLDQRRDSVSSNVSTESGSKKHVTFATVKKASPSSSLYSLKMDDGTASMTGSITGSISSNDSGEKKAPFSSFSRLGGTPTSSLKRSGSTSSSSSLKSILSNSLPVQMPKPPSGSQASPNKSASPSPVFNRPTSLALSKTVDSPSKRLQSIGEGQPTEVIKTTAKKTVLTDSKKAENMKQKMSNTSISGLESPKGSSVLGLNRKQPITAKVSPIMKTDRSKFTNGPNQSRALPPASPLSSPSSPRMQTLPKAEPVKFRLSNMRTGSLTRDGAPKKELIGRVTPTQKSQPSSPKVEAKDTGKSLQENGNKPSANEELKSEAEGVKSAMAGNVNNVTNIGINSSQNKDTKESDHGPAQKGDSDHENPSEQESPCRGSSLRKSYRSAIGKDNVLMSSSKSSNTLVNKPPPAPMSSTNSKAASPSPKSQSKTGASSPNKARLSSALTTSTSSLTPSVGNDSVSSMNKSISSLDISSSSLKGSRLSLNKSTDSLASNSSAASVIERTRAARLAFLGQSQESATNKSPESSPPSDPFARFKSSKTSTEPTVTKNVDDRFAKYKIGQRKSSTSSTNSGSSLTNSPPNVSPTLTGPSQGRFVNSVISSLVSKSGDVSPTSPTTPSSGLGSSIASPLSPVKTLPASENIFQKDSALKTGANLNSNNNNSKKETCC